MPIVAWWPNIIILFELTMLGAILATVVSLFITADLPNIRPKVYDPAVSRGKILVAVEGPADSRTVESTLRATPVDEIKRN